jgi:hypothetical protein
MAERQIISDNTVAPVNSTTFRESKLTFTLSNGNLLVLARSLKGAADAPTKNNIYVYEVPQDRTQNPVLRATIAAPVDFSEITGATFSNNDLGILITAADLKTFRYCKFTYATYAVSAWETPFTALTSTNVIQSADLAVSDTGYVAIGWTMYNGTNATAARMYGRTTGNTWGTVYNVAISTGAQAPACDAASILCLGGTTTARNIIMAHGIGQSSNTAQDRGVRLTRIQVNETTNGVTLAGTFIETLMSATALTSPNASVGQRIVRLYRLANDEFGCMIMQSTNDKYVAFKSATLSGSTYTTKVALVSSKIPATVSIVSMATAAKVPSARVEGLYYGTFTFAYAHMEGSKLMIRSTVLRQTGSKTHNSFTYYNTFAAVTAAFTHGVGSLGAGNLDKSQSDLYYPIWTNVGMGNAWGYISYAAIPTASTQYDPAIRELIPAVGTGVLTQNPVVGGKIAFQNGPYVLPAGQSKYKAQWQFDDESTFTAPQVDYTQPDSKFNHILSASLDNPYVLSETLPVPATLPSGVPTWQMRMRLIDEYYNYGPWKEGYFVIGHPSTGVPITPQEGKTYYQNGGLINFDWEFSDPSPSDVQTAYRVVIMNNLTTLYDSGKVASSAKRYTHQFDVGNTAAWLNRDLYWSIEVWDSNDQSVPNPLLNNFFLSNPPTVDIDTINGSAIETNPVVGTGVPVIAGTLQSGGQSAISSAMRKLKEFTLQVTQAGIPVWSKQFVGPFEDDYAFAEKVPTGFLKEQEYTLSASVVDEANIAGSSALYQFSVDWVSPAGPATVVVNTALYNTEDEGYVSVTWDDASREVNNFVAWNVYRKVDLINPTTGVVLEEGNKELIHVEAKISESYEYKDFYAPAGYKVTYSITQSVNRLGQDIESDGSTATVVETFPASDGYWLINPDTTNTDADAFKISIVTGDEFTEEQEESEFTVIGRGRTVQKGENLGAKGQLSCQLRDTGGTTARQKRLRLKAIQQAKGQLWLRNPFGDIFKVNVSSMSVSRVAGVGTNEFVDVTIPYAEVS